MKKMTLTIALIFCFIGIGTLSAQVLMREASLKKQIDNSSLVIEGKVVDKKSFWDDNHRIIYTANTVEVYKVFKGEPLTTVEVITLGGTVGLHALIANPSLKLRLGDAGIFTLQNNNVAINTKSKSTKKAFRPYGSSQGFYKYNLYDDLAVNPFNKKKGIKSSFYNEIMSHTKNDYRVISNFDTQSKSLQSKQSKNLLVPTSIAFTPTTATAGTKEVLTITGSDFGAVKGKVGFSNADDGGATFVDALDSQVLTWSDTQITVEIPSVAGTGKVRVTDGAVTPTSDVSASDLTISYAELNVEGDFGDGELAYQVQHIGQSGGGYTWEMFTDFFDDSEHPGAKAAFERAFNNWVCETGVNWTISSSATTVDEAIYESETDPEPPVNVIRFDNGDELETITSNDDILGVCFSWYAGCGPSPLKWRVEELDIVFDSDINDSGTPETESWYFGSDTGGITSDQWDFESVALHELGHGHQLGHVINTNNDVMHYTLLNDTTQRVLSADNSTAANNVQTRSTTSMVCVRPLMTSISCPLSVENKELDKAISLYPNPAKSIFYIKNDSFINLEKVNMYDISGRLISKVDISNNDSSKTKTINVTGLSKGIYFVNIHSDSAMITRKMVLD
ncbi:T9SS type A sorting domain-containing protein [Flavivirga spongiicola]|uniref:T9SS type A sorting domain-containing protein n=1 Tax=Flavivirga spongiicola TaxID=421621 RepID=A0ABU7XRY6_9FLAO|nr:T9SS type A sorting domain-containing protein [Flavivirga sp. MEBiC05379]MDO5978518.1 T9SS type A sorting domain-containing protein [Flavivirga sp. MEBiC05379]